MSPAYRARHPAARTALPRLPPFRTHLATTPATLPIPLPNVPAFLPRPLPYRARHPSAPAFLPRPPSYYQARLLTTPATLPNPPSYRARRYTEPHTAPL